MKTLAQRREYQRRYYDAHDHKLRGKVFPCPWKHSDGCTFESTDPEKHHEHCHEHELAEMKDRPEEPVIKPCKTQKQPVAERAKRLDTAAGK
jgi:hypothetical protein